jgi:hypothetical protein
LDSGLRICGGALLPILVLLEGYGSDAQELVIAIALRSVAISLILAAGIIIWGLRQMNANGSSVQKLEPK